MTQHEHLPPAGYVQACEVVTHGDRIDPEVRVSRLATGSYPSIIRALNLIREDNGGPSWPPEQEPLVATRWESYLGLLEETLSGLSDTEPAPEDSEAVLRVVSGEGCYLDSELYVFCNGEYSVMELLKARSPEMKLTSHFLNDFFEGWGWYSDTGFDPTQPPPE